MEDKTEQNISRSLKIVLSLILLVISLIQYHSACRRGAGSDSEVQFASEFLLIVYVFAIYSWIGETRRCISPYFMFLVACFLFNAGQIFLNLFDLSNNGFVNIFNIYSSDIFLKMLYFQASCLAMLNIGALLGVNKKTRTIFKKGFTNLYISNEKHFTVPDIVFLLCACYLLVVFSMRIVFRAGGTYTDVFLEYDSEGGSYFVATASFVFHITYFYGLYKNYNNSKKKLMYFILGFIWITLLLLIGGRFKIVPIIAGTIILSYMNNDANGKQLGKGKTILLIVLGVLAFSFMEGYATVRDMDLKAIKMDELTFIYSEGFLENLYATISEAGASARCILSTMLYIDGKSATTESSFLYALANGLLPGSILDSLGFSMKNLSLSTWITDLEASKNGWGYSVFAECYYNLSGYGFIWMFFIGFALVRLEALSISLFRSEFPFKQLLGCCILFTLVDAIFLARANMKLISPDIRRTLYVFVLGLLLQKKIPYPQEIPNNNVELVE